MLDLGLPLAHGLALGLGLLLVLDLCLEISLRSTKLNIWIHENLKLDSNGKLFKRSHNIS